MKVFPSAQVVLDHLNKAVPETYFAEKIYPSLAAKLAGRSADPATINLTFAVVYYDLNAEHGPSLDLADMMGLTDDMKACLPAIAIEEQG